MAAGGPVAEWTDVGKWQGASKWAGEGLKLLKVGPASLEWVLSGVTVEESVPAGRGQRERVAPVGRRMIQKKWNSSGG